MMASMETAATSSLDRKRCAWVLSVVMGDPWPNRFETATMSRPAVIRADPCVWRSPWKHGS